MEVFIDHHTHSYVKKTDISQCADIIRIRNASLYDISEDYPFTIGLHPYDTVLFTDDNIQKIYELAKNDNCVGIGECGIDRLHNEKHILQKEFFEKQIEISELLQKPLVIHLVRATNDLLEIRKRLNPKQPWIIHGFRGKMSLAQIFIDQGIYLSMGQYHNRQSLFTAYNSNSLLLETDESTMCITEIYKEISHEIGISCEKLAYYIYKNTPFNKYISI